MYGITPLSAEYPDLSRGNPTPVSIGVEDARTNPTMREAIIAPDTDPMVPSTITAKAGSRRAKPVVGLNSSVTEKIAPPTPVIPAERNALVCWTLSTFIPLLAASSGLSATALILIPSLVLFSSRTNIATEMNTTTGRDPLALSLIHI